MPKKPESIEASGCIFWFEAKDNCKDDEGNDLIGAYYCILDKDGNELTGMCGPYPTVDEAGTACEQVWENEDFW